MTLASLLLSNDGWLAPLGIVAAALLGILVWGYRAPAGRGFRGICLCLKLAGGLLLAFCALEPRWSGWRAQPGANLFAVVADNSAGLGVRDRGETSTRGEQLRQMLGSPDTGWQAELAGHFALRRYRFDARLEPVHGFEELTFDGGASGLGAALRALARRYRGRPLAGILLFSDGNATDIAGAPLDLTDVPPVYPVAIGRADRLRDLAVQSPRVSLSAFEDAPVSVYADVQTAGFDGETVAARLRDPAGQIVAELHHRVRRNPETIPFHFQLKPDRDGLLVYRLESGDAGALASGLAPTNSTEATLVNNRRWVIVNRERGPYRILYVAGRPNWEYKFLQRAIAADPQLDLVALIRVARREPRFEFRGRAGETGNPLFRGFDRQSREEAERYDQPVLIRLNTRDEIELRSGFPRVAEDLYAYHAVIVDDLEAEFFAPDQALLLQKFVSERGGGFLMLGGAESYQAGRYQRTPIGDMLPVYLDPADPPPAGSAWRIELSREGGLQAWARLRAQESDEQAVRLALPPLQVLHTARAIKPGASLIATGRDEAGQTQPALVVQRFGRGRSAALLAGDLWRWGMRDAAARRDLDQAWRQLLRWLVTDVPRPVDLEIEPPPDSLAGAVRLEARVRDPRYQPLDNAIVTLDVEPVEASSESPPRAFLSRLLVEPSLDEAGRYEAVFVPRAPGAYRASAAATNIQGAEVGRAEKGWTYDPLADEFRSLVPNRDLLERIARETGGEVITAGQIGDLVRRLPWRAAPIREPWSYPIWHTPLWFGLAIACFLAEWGIRRWKGWP